MSLIEAYKKDNLEEFRGLLKKNINPDSGIGGFSPLQIICQRMREGAEEYVQLLLRYGADPNKMSNNSHPLAGIVNSCLGKRVNDVSESVVKIAGLLLEHGAYKTFTPESVSTVVNSSYERIARVGRLFYEYGLFDPGSASASLKQSQLLRKNILKKYSEDDQKEAATREVEAKRQAEVQRQVEIQKQAEIQRQMQAEVERQAEAKRQAETKREVEIEGQKAIQAKNALAQNQLMESNELAIENVRSLLKNLAESLISAGKHVQAVVIGVEGGLYDLTGIIRAGFEQLKDCDTLIRNAIPKPLWRGVLGMPTDEEVAEANMRVNQRWDTIQYVANVIIELFNDVVIISAAHLSSSTMSEFPVYDFTNIDMLQKAITNNPALYTEAVLRMNNRGETINQVVTDFQQLKSHDQTEVITRLATNLYAPGILAKAGQSVYTNSQNIFPRLESQSVLPKVVGKSVEKVTETIGVMEHIKNLKGGVKNSSDFGWSEVSKLFFQNLKPAANQMRRSAMEANRRARQHKAIAGIMRRVERQNNRTSPLVAGRHARDKFLHHFSHLQSRHLTSQRVKSAIEANRRARQHKQKVTRILTGLFPGGALSYAEQIKKIEERRAKKIGMMIASRVHFRSHLSFKIFLEKHEGLTAKLFQKQLKSTHLTNQMRRSAIEANRRARQHKAINNRISSLMAGRHARHLQSKPTTNQMKRSAIEANCKTRQHKAIAEIRKNGGTQRRKNNISFITSKRTVEKGTAFSSAGGSYNGLTYMAATRMARENERKEEREIEGRKNLISSKLGARGGFSHARQIEELEEWRAKQVQRMLDSRVDFGSHESFKRFYQQHKDLSAKSFDEQLISRYLINQMRKSVIEVNCMAREYRLEEARMRKNEAIQSRKNRISSINSRRTVKKGIAPTSAEVRDYDGTPTK